MSLTPKIDKDQRKKKVGWQAFALPALHY